MLGRRPAIAPARAALTLPALVLTALPLTALPLAACADATVVRVIDGREVVGRFVSARAYALYARGAESEARGELESARLEYLAAAGEDEDSAEIWTRVGAVSCALGRADDARGAFARAAERASGYEPLHRERAECALSRALGPLSPPAAAAALDDAAAALALDPDSEETALLYARAAEHAGRPELAERALRELVARFPGRSAGWRALADLAARHGDHAAEARAAQALDALGAPRGAPPPATAKAPGAASPPPASPALGPRAVSPDALLADVDAALGRDALDEARTAAKRARLPPAELAVRAAALGRARVGRTQAELVFLADPGSASAAIALAVASDLLRDDGGVVRALANAGARTTPPSPLARLLFAELILRRTDRDAARAFLGPIAPAHETADPLLRAVTERVAARLRP